MSRLSKVSFLFSGLSLVSMVLVRYLIGEWVPFCWVALGLCVFFFAFSLFHDRKFFTAFFAMKTTKNGMNMGAMILLVLALIVIVNFIAVRKYKVFDFSLARTNTISDQSVKLLKSLDADLKIRFFYKKGVEGNEENRRSFRDLVKKYQDYSDKVFLDFIEVNERPDLATDFGVDKGSGVVFLEYKGRRNRIDKIEEQDMSSALVKVTREKIKNIYFTTGSGERSLEEAREATGLNSLKLLLESNSYKVQALPLNQKPRVPEDADIVIVAGPSHEIQSQGIKALEDYLQKGGSLLLAVKTKAAGGLEPLLKKVGVMPQNDYIWSVVDTTLGRGINQGPLMASVFSKESEITKNFGKDELVLFLYPMSLKFMNPMPPAIMAEDLVRTNESSVSFKTLDIKGAGDNGAFAVVGLVKGKFPGASQDAKDFSLIVAGDVDFMNNQLLYKNMNRDLVLNSVAYLAKEEGLISISAKEPQKTEMILTRTKFTFFIFGFIIPLPLLLLGAAVGIWLRRRNA